MLSGILMIMLGAAFLGSFAFPSKYVKNYEWENTWGSFFFFAMLVVPVILSTLIIKGLWATYLDVPQTIIIGVVALGFLWGIGFCLWGNGLAMVGLSLGYTLTMGTMALVGSILPFFMGSAHMALTPGGMLVIFGILVCIAGVVINGMAGMKREKTDSEGAEQSAKHKKYMLKGLIICVLAGVLSSGCNVAFHIGSNVGDITNISVEKYGNAGSLAGISVWNLIFLGGLISSFGYSAILLFKNRTWKGFLVKGSGKNLGLTAIMALAHFACLFFYGAGSFKLGVLGTSVGFAIFQSGSLLLGNGFGFFTGEWKNAPKVSKNYLFAGLTVLIAGIVIVSVGNAMIS
jgi:L-rhamnose-H+ transport protein